MAKSPPKTVRSPKSAAGAVEAEQDRMLMRNWFVFGAATLSAFLALTLRAVPLVPRDEIVLLAFWCLAVIGLFVYLTLRQRNILRTRRQKKSLREHDSRMHYERALRLFNLGTIMDPRKPPSKILDGIVRVCLEIFSCEKASLMLAQPGGHLEVQAAVGYQDRKIIGTKQKVGDGIAGWVAKHGKPILLVDPKDRKKYPGLEFKARSVAAAMVVPIILKDKLIGVINVSSRAELATFDERDLEALLVFAENVGTWINHTFAARALHQKIEELERALATQGGGKQSPVVNLPYSD